MSDSRSPLPKSYTSNRFAVTPFGCLDEGAGHSESLRGIESFISAADLSVVFQPIVELSPLRIFAYEALVRCAAPGFSDPSVLFGRAVDEHCTGRLGRMIREVAVPLCSGFPLFLNVHPVELQERWLVRPDDPLFFHDDTVYLEVTETVPLTHFSLCWDVLSELRARGNVMLVVDDLGAGYSNLKYIADLEPRMVKLDRGLVEGIAESKRRRQLVAGIVRLCVDVGSYVIAEGIETPDELAALMETGVHFGQGFLFARPGFPLPGIAEEALALL